MATLFEYFRGNFRDGSVDFDLVIAERSDPSAIVASLPVRVYFNGDSFARYVAVFFSEQEYTENLAAAVIPQAPDILARSERSVEVVVGTAGVYPGMSDTRALTFTGRMILYIDSYVPEATKESLTQWGAQNNVHVQVRDRTYADVTASDETPLAFISHDSRDKEEIARPLAEKLRSMLCPIWYDEYSLKPGDSLREAIDQGLRDAKRCVIILSPHFLANPGWAKGEFNAAVDRHMNQGGGLIIPIWHNVTRIQVADYSQMIAGTVAINSSIGVDAVARDLFRVLVT